MDTKTKSLSILLLAISSFRGDKNICIKFSEDQLNNHFNNLDGMKEIIEKSDISKKDLMFIISSINSLQKDIISQVQKQQLSIVPA